MMTGAVRAEAQIWRGLEPEGRGHELLQTWALYRRNGNLIGLPKLVGCGLNEPLDKARDEEPAWVVLVDRALASVYRVHPVYQRMIKMFYLDNRAIWDVAETVRRTEGFVALSLRGICAHVESRVNL